MCTNKSKKVHKASAVWHHWPDGDNLAKVQLIMINLCYEDGRHGLIQGSAVHVDSSAHWQHKPYDAPVDVIIL